MPLGLDLEHRPYCSSSSRGGEGPGKLRSWPLPSQAFVSNHAPIKTCSGAVFTE
jgi:hypothetical protein